MLFYYSEYTVSKHFYRKQCLIIIFEFSSLEPGLQNFYDSGALKLVVKLLSVASDAVTKLIFEKLLKEIATKGKFK